MVHMYQKQKNSNNQSFLKIYEPCSDKKELNSLPNDKFLDWSKLKACTDDKIKVT